MKNLIIIMVVALFVQGCATVYQTRGLTGGYSEIQLDKNVFRVSFAGNGHTSRERVSAFTLLRSAELALNNEFQYFAIIDEDSYTSRAITTTEGGETFGGETFGGETFHIPSIFPSQAHQILSYVLRRSLNQYSLTMQSLSIKVSEKI